MCNGGRCCADGAYAVYRVGILLRALGRLLDVHVLEEGVIVQRCRRGRFCAQLARMRLPSISIHKRGQPIPAPPSPIPITSRIRPVTVLTAKMRAAVCTFVSHASHRLALHWPQCHFAALTPSSSQMTGMSILRQLRPQDRDPRAIKIALCLGPLLKWARACFHPASTATKMANPFGSKDAAPMVRSLATLLMVSPSINRNLNNLPSIA